MRVGVARYRIHARARDEKSEAAAQPSSLAGEKNSFRAPRVICAQVEGGLDERTKTQSGPRVERLSKWHNEKLVHRYTRDGYMYVWRILEDVGPDDCLQSREDNASLLLYGCGSETRMNIYI